jgi:hypothetical protein
MEELGAACLRVVGEETEASAEHSVFEAMLDGWRAQRLSRTLTVRRAGGYGVVVLAAHERVGGGWRPPNRQAPSLNRL